MRNDGATRASGSSIASETAARAAPRCARLANVTTVTVSARAVAVTVAPRAPSRIKDAPRMSQARRMRPALALLAGVAMTLTLGPLARAEENGGVSAGGDAAVPTPEPPPTRYFYHQYDYGSQSLYSPLWVFLNRGYDVLQDHVASRNVFEQHYRTNTGNVLRNLANPFPAISADGWKTFLTEEIFPLSFTSSHRALGAELHAALDRRRHDVHRARRVVRRSQHPAAAPLVGPDVDGVGVGQRDPREQGDRRSQHRCDRRLLGVRHRGHDPVQLRRAQPLFLQPGAGDLRLVAAAVVHRPARPVAQPGQLLRGALGAAVLSPPAPLRQVRGGDDRRAFVSRQRRVLDLGVGGRLGGPPGQPVDDAGREHRGVHAHRRRLSRSQRVIARVGAGHRHRGLLHLGEHVSARVVFERAVRRHVDRDRQARPPRVRDPSLSRLLGVGVGWSSLS